MSEKDNKIFSSFVIIVTVLLMSLTAYSEDYETPHKFKPGDVISADMMNEVFGYIKKAKKTVTPQYFLGDWTCTSITRGPINSQTVSGWTESADAWLYLYQDGVAITFSDDGDSTYSLTTSAPDPFQNSNSNAVIDRPYDVIKNLFFLGEDGGYNFIYEISTISKNRFYWVPLIAGAFEGAKLICCDKNDLPPDNPTDLTAEVSGFEITLSWSDNSDNETGFKILSKDSLTGTYQLIDTVSNNSTTYGDNVPEKGTYWYRINATNNNGDSLGSNVIKVVVD